MNQSEGIGKLAAALAKAQGKFKAPKKERTVDTGSYTYKYADLSDVLEAIVPALSENELALMQTTEVEVAQGEDGKAIQKLRLVTTLAHSSGEWVRGYYPLRWSEKPQEMGSAITYARRYAAQAIVGINAEQDDDAQRAQGESRLREVKRG